MERYDTSILAPLLNAWASLKHWWKHETMPLTNNTSEHLYGNLWPRQRKRDKRTDTRKRAWFTEALWRHNHKPVNGKSPFESLWVAFPEALPRKNQHQCKRAFRKVCEIPLNTPSACRGVVYFLFDRPATASPLSWLNPILPKPHTTFT